MPITALPTPPSRSDPTNFATRADAFLGALPTFATEANALASDVNSQQITAVNAANTATAAASTAVSASGATVWVSGTTYAQYAVVISPATFFSYRRKTAGAGTVDPGADAANWTQISGTGNVSTSSAGNLGIGYGSPGVPDYGGATRTLGVNSSASGQVIFDLALGGVRQATITTRADATVLTTMVNTPFVLGTNNFERARIDTAGAFFINATNQLSGSSSRLVLRYNGGGSEYGLFLSSIDNSSTVTNAITFARNSTNSDNSVGTIHGWIRQNNAAMWFGSGGALYLDAGGNTRIQVAANGLIGINTDPQAVLHIKDALNSNNELLRLQHDTSFISFYNSANTVRKGYIQFEPGATTISNEINAPMYFNTNGNQQVQITAVGTLYAQSKQSNEKLRIQSDAVNGTAYMSIVTSSGSTAIGYIGTTQGLTDNLASNNLCIRSESGIGFQVGGGGSGTMPVRIASNGYFTYLGKEVGFRGNPSVTASADGSSWLNGYFHHIFSGTTWTPVNKNAGDTYVLYNGTGSSVTLSNSTVAILHTATAGNASRTLAPNACVTVYYLNTSTVVLSGTGIS